MPLPGGHFMHCSATHCVSNTRRRLPRIATSTFWRLQFAENKTASKRLKWPKLFGELPEKVGPFGLKIFLEDLHRYQKER
jgi:hypothetical protein